MTTLGVSTTRPDSRLSDLRRRQVMTVGAYVAAAAATAFDAGPNWPVVLVAQVVVGASLFTAMNNGLIAAPVVGICLLALATMLDSDGPPVGSLVAVVLAFVVGELLADCRNTRLKTGWRSSPLPDGVAPVATLAVLGMTVALVVSALPGTRFFAVTAAAGLGLLTLLVVQSRQPTRSNTSDVSPRQRPLPPPPSSRERWQRDAAPPPPPPPPWAQRG